MQLLVSSTQRITSPYAQRTNTSRPIQFDQIQAPKQIYSLTFKSKSKNPNQILVLSSECAPYAKAGGMADVIRDFPAAYNKVLAKKDMRIMIPLYNADSQGPKMHNGKPILEIFDKDSKSSVPKRYELKHTGISVDFDYGARKSKAILYEIKKPDNKVKTYVVYSPAFSYLPKEYAGSFYQNYGGFSAFNKAALSLLKKMPDTQENFNPKVIHTNDWHTAFAIHGLKDLAGEDEFYGDIKSVHTIHNGSGFFQGKNEPFSAILNTFNKKEFENLVKDSEFRSGIVAIIEQNKNLFCHPQNGVISPQENVLSCLTNKNKAKKILGFFGDNYEQIMAQPNSREQVNKINDRIRALSPQVLWDEHNCYNPTALAVNEADNWMTVSGGHYNELLSSERYSSEYLKIILEKNKEKGLGITNGIDAKRYDPSNPHQIAVPFKTTTVTEGKLANKKFLFEQFSQKNITDKTIDTKLMAAPDKAIIKGYLNNANADGPLITAIGRFDTGQKGADIIMHSATEILDANPKATMVLAWPGCFSYSDNSILGFIDKVVENDKYKGRVVLVDSFVPVNQYLAGADFTLLPSRSETCGLVQYQSLRLGSIPITSTAGAYKDSIINIEENRHKANGFKTPHSLLFDPNPVSTYLDTAKKALTTFETDKDLLLKMRKNGLTYNSDWKKSVKLYDQMYQRLISQSSKIKR